MNSIYLATKRYWDKTGGNTYFASRVYIDGKQVARLPFQYGYGSADEAAAISALVEFGFIPESESTRQSRPLWYVARENGADYYQTPIDGYYKKRDVKAWAAPDA